MTHNPWFLTWDQMATEWERWAADVAQRPRTNKENSGREEDQITIEPGRATRADETELTIEYDEEAA